MCRMRGVGSGRYRRLLGVIGVITRVWIIRLLRGLLASAFEFVADFAASVLELADALAQASGQLRNFVSPEKHEDNDHDKNQFGSTDVAQK